jgi:GNAT superfamily N-acetyltransferase
VVQLASIERPFLKAAAKATSEIVLAVGGPRITKGLVEITNAEPAEADILTSIAFAAKRHWGYPEHWILQWKSLLTITPESVAMHETFAARADGHVLGFGALKLEGEKLHLNDLWVLPAEMRRGVGRALFRHAQWRARVRGFSWFEIESDPYAVHFYTHMGAAVIGEHVTSLDGQPRRLPVLRCSV